MWVGSPPCTYCYTYMYVRPSNSFYSSDHSSNFVCEAQRTGPSERFQTWLRQGIKLPKKKSLPTIDFYVLKFTFSEKATKIDKIFNVNLTVCSNRQIDGEDLSIFVAFLENMKFKTMAKRRWQKLTYFTLQMHFKADHTWLSTLKMPMKQLMSNSAFKAFYGL